MTRFACSRDYPAVWLPATAIQLTSTDIVRARYCVRKVQHGKERKQIRRFKVRGFGPTQDCWLEFHVDGEAVDRGLDDDADHQKEALEIVSADGEEPEGFEDADLLCQKRESQVGMFPSFSDPLGHRALEIRYLVGAKSRSVRPREMVIVHSRVDQVEFPEIAPFHLIARRTARTFLSASLYVCAFTVTRFSRVAFLDSR